MQIENIQALRALACLMVVLYHALQAAGGEAAIAAWPNGSAGVDLFFCMSGFVMVTASRGLARPGGWRVFLGRRLGRIVPLYWGFTGVKLGLVLLVPSWTVHTRPDGWNLAASLMFVPSRDALGTIRPVLPIGWTLNFEMLFYALFAVALAWRVTPFRFVAPTLGLLCLAGFFRQPDWPAPLSLCNGMVMEFAAGMAVANWRGRRRTLPPRSAWTVLVASGGLLLALPLAGPWRFAIWGLPATAILAACVSLEGWKMPRAILAIGDASYAIYLIHPFVIGVIGRTVSGACLAVIASVACGILVHRRVDAPIQAWLKDRPLRRSPAENRPAAIAP